MVRHGLVVFSILLAGSGLAFAQSGGPDGPDQGPHHGPGKHRPMPPPPGLQGKGFVLEMGHGKSLRVQCGNEPLKGCMDAVRPLIAQLGHGPAGAQAGGPGAMGAPQRPMGAGPSAQHDGMGSSSHPGQNRAPKGQGGAHGMAGQNGQSSQGSSQDSPNGQGGQSGQNGGGSASDDDDMSESGSS